MINKEQLLDFERLGFTNPDDLLIFGTNKEADKSLSMMLNIPEVTITRLILAAGLIRIEGIGTRNYSLLKKVGVNTIPALPREDLNNLYRKLNDINRSNGQEYKVPRVT